MAATLTVVQVPRAAAAADPALTVTTQAPQSVLAGEPVAYSLTASNPTAGAEYNVSFRDVLPVGVSYRAGSTGPDGVSEPTVITDPDTLRQTVIWSDTFDLQAGATSGLTFAVDIDNAQLPVAASIGNTPSAYASTDARVVPKFDAAGAPVTDPVVVAATGNTTTTTVTALAVDKSEPSPEHELLRGIHTQQTVYTIKVTNNGEYATDGTVVTDYLPADLEYLGCAGQADNSAAGTEEYPGSGRVSVAAPSANCLAPSSVTTVQNPTGYPAGVYTRVDWTIGDLVTNGVRTISYAAAVPLRENTTGFANGAPSGASLGQVANLDNNTGPSTRQSGAGAAATNHVHVTGSYQGPVQGGPNSGATVAADDDLTVTVHDLRIHKATDVTQFVAGQIATFTLTLDAGEYTDSDGITVTDTLDNGMCPLGEANYANGAPADCDADTGHLPSLPYSSVTHNADGTFTLVFEPAAIGHDATSTITYYAMMRGAYQDGTPDGDPTVAGDTFENTATQTATTTARAGTGESGTDPVTDPTAVTLTTSVESLSKTIATRTTPMDCASGTYQHDPDQADVTFVKGDRVCFELQLPFSTSMDTRDAVLTDLLPTNLTYESWTLAPGNTVPSGQVQFAQDAGSLTWTLGSLTGGHRFVAAGEVLVIQLAATVNAAAQGTAVDKTGNLLKLRSTDTDGSVRSLRDEVNFQVAPAPIAISKGVASVNGQPATDNPADTDHVQVAETDAVVFRVDVRNTSGTAATGPAVTESALDVWDVLPTGISCGDVSGTSDGGTCTNPGDAGQPAFSGNSTHSAVRWNAPAGVSIPGGGSYTFRYTVTMPASSASDTLSNNAAVRSYAVDTDRGTTTTYYPGQNVDTSVAAADQDAKPAADPSDVYLAGVTLAKAVTSAIAETGNRGGEPIPQASTDGVPGEVVTFTVSARIPAHTSVFSASLTDPLPAGLDLESTNLAFAPDATTPETTASVPAGVDLTGTTVSFGTGYDNTSGTDQLFTLTVTAWVGGTASGTLTNTATFDSGRNPDRADGTDPAARTASAQVAVEQPAATLVKTITSGSPATGGAPVGFRLTAGNSGPVPLHDVHTYDCVPNGLSFDAFGTATLGTAADDGSGAGSPCAVGTHQLHWTIDTLAPGATATLDYTAIVQTDPTGAVSYTNTATLTGDSLAATDPDQAVHGKSYTKTGSSTVIVAGATVTKSATPSKAAVGDTVTFNATVTVPKNVTFYNLSVIDTVPAGIVPGSVALGGVSCTPSCALGLTALTAGGNTLGWLVGDVTADSADRAITFSYTARVGTAAPTAGGAMQNSMHPAWDTTPKPAPTSATGTFDTTGPDARATVTVTEPNLTIGKTVSRTSAAPGDTFTYTVTVKNAVGANVSTAYHVGVSDAVPAGVIIEDPGTGTLTGADGTTGGGGTLTWTDLGPIAPGASVVLSYTGRFVASGDLPATAQQNSVRVTGYDSAAANARHYGPSAAAVATVTPQFPRLVTAKSMPGGPLAYLGAPFSWKVTVTNSGAAKAYNVSAVDTLPPNWTYASGSATITVGVGSATALADPDISSAGGVQTLSWDMLGELSSGTALTIVYQAVPQPGAGITPGVGMSANHTNAVTPSGQDATGATGNKSASYSAGPATATAHIASADVAITKAVGTAPVAGQDASWTLTVTDHGPDTAVGPFHVTDTSSLPAGVTLVSVIGSGWTCTSATDPDTPAIDCSRTNPADTLASGASFPAIAITYHVAADVANGTDYPNTAMVSGVRTHDPDPANNSGTNTATVTTHADLGISKQLSGSMTAGRDATYTIAVHNYGPSDSQGPIIVQDAVPSGTTFVSAGATGWTCDDATGGTLSCTHGTIATGAAAEQIVVVVHVASGRTAAITNGATVTPTTDEGANTHPDTSTVTTTPDTSADLAIGKQLDGELVAGSTATYTITVDNHGPSAAQHVVVTDTLPSLLSYDASAPPAGWTCSAAGQTVTCTQQAASLASSDSVSFTIQVLVDQQFQGTVSNTAQVGSDTADPDTGNNSVDVPSDVTDYADLSIAKSHGGGAVTAGTDVPYTLQVHNSGPSHQEGDLEVTDHVPSGMRFVSATGTGWDCAYAGVTRTVTCTGATDLASGGDADPITVTLHVDPDAGPAIITNSAAVSGNPAVPDTDLTNNTDEDPTTVVVDTDVTLTKSVTTATPVVAGTEVIFALQAGNAGPSDAADVTVTDTLPAGMSYATATGSGWTCAASGQLVTCHRDTLPANPPAADVAAITLTASVAASVADGTVLHNTAQISTPSPGTTHQPAPVDVPVIARADLILTKTASAATTSAGTGVTWTVAVRNAGASDAVGPITVTDTLPGYERVTTADGTGWTCTPGAAPVSPADPQSLTCTLPGPLAAGSSAADITVAAHVDPTAPVGDHVNAAEVAAATDDPTPGNNADAATTSVSRTAALAITKTHSGTAQVGLPLTFQLAVRNDGPSTATGVRVVDPLPVGLTYSSAAGTSWGCTAAGQRVICDLAGSLAPGAAADPISLTVTIDAAAYPALTNVATVSSTDPDLPGSSEASDLVTVDPDASLTLVKEHRGTFTVGTPGSYLLTVGNSGATATPGPVAVTDTLPEGLSFVSAAGDGFSCTGHDRDVRCVRGGSLAVGATASIVLVVDVHAGAYPEVSNSAEATAPGSPSVTATDVAPVTPVAVLSLTKTVSSYRGGEATYVITVHNSGPSRTSETVAVTDPLPAGLTLGAADGTGWQCSANGATVRCEHDAPLAAGDESSLTVRTAVAAADGTRIENVASISGGGASDPSAVAGLTVGRPQGSGGTASTGVPTAQLLQWAALLLLAGGIVLVLARRRRAG